MAITNNSVSTLEQDTAADPEPKPRRKTHWKAAQSSDLYRHLSQYDRSPIIAELSRWMEHGPSDDAIEAMADSQPHKWTAAIRQLSMIAGFADRSEHLEVRAIVDMSDSQLEMALRAKLDSLRGQGLTIEGVAEEPLVAEKAHK